MNNEYVGNVANYINSIMYYDWDGECYCQSRPCPFASFEEAIAAYELHMKRVENRSYLTIDERRHYELENKMREKGIFVKKLRPRKRLRPRRDGSE